MRCATAVLLVLLVTGVVVAVEPPAASDPMLDKMVEWNGRAVEELRLDGAPPPHRVVIALTEIVAFAARADFGAITLEGPRRQRQGRVEVVVGDDRLDSSRFKDSHQRRYGGGGPPPRQRITVAVADDELPFDRDLWISLDASYKAALQQWQAKVAAREAIGGDAPPPDWSPAEPVVAVDLAPIEPIDESTLRQIAIEASAALVGAGPLDQGEVAVGAVNLRFRTVTSEGTRIVQPEGYAAVHALASLLRDDGVRITDELQWVARRVRDLPSREEIVEQTAALGRNVVARAAADPVDYYEGPVIFEDRAAAEFFRYLLTPEILGTPPVPEAGRSYKRQTRRGPRLGRRLLPDGWSATDDPTRTPEGLTGGAPYDREGVPGETVRLIEDGYVRDFLRNRVPLDEEGRSNGHARGSVTGAWFAQPSIWRVEPRKNLTNRAFDKAVNRARERGRQDRVLVVRRLHRERIGRLPSPTLAVWRYPDGREEPVELLEFQNVDRRTLRSIAAAGGGEFLLPYLAPWSPGEYPVPERGLATLLTAPRRLLVEDMELVSPGSDEKPHAYPRP